MLFVLVALSSVSALQLKKIASKDQFAYVTMWLKKELVPGFKMSDVMTQSEEQELDQANPSEKQNQAARLHAQVSEESLGSEVPKGGTKMYGPSFVFEMDNNMRAAGSVYPLLVVTNDPEMINAPELKEHPLVQIVEMGADKTVEFVRKGAKLQGRNAVHWHKLAIFSMTDYKKMIYMDLDTKVNKNIDHIFTDEQFDTRDGQQVWGIVNDFTCGHNASRVRSDFFNSAVMLLEPKKETMESMVEFSQGKQFYGDQAVIQAYFSFNKDAQGKKVTDPALRKKARIFPTKMADFMACHKKGAPQLEVEHHR